MKWRHFLNHIGFLVFHLFSFFLWFFRRLILIKILESEFLSSFRMVTSQMKNVNNILGIITQTSKKSFQYGITLLMAFCNISDNREISLEIMKTEPLHCRGINLHLLFKVPIFKYLFLFYFFSFAGPLLLCTGFL